MGVNQSNVENRTGGIVYVVSFNDSERLYYNYRDFRQVPTGATIMVDGLAGGAAVKVGVIYNEFGGRVIFDLFHVEHGYTLTVKMISQEAGVTSYSDIRDHVYRLYRGMSVGVSSDQMESVRNALAIVGSTMGLAGQAGRAGRRS